MVGEPAGSPCKCSRITTGMQVLNGALVGLEVTLEMLAKIPATPGVTAVASPLPSTVTTEVFVLAQVTGPAVLAMSAAFGEHGPEDAGGVTSVEQTCAVN